MALETGGDKTINLTPNSQSATSIGHDSIKRAKNITSPCGAAWKMWNVYARSVCSSNSTRICLEVGIGKELWVCAHQSIFCFNLCKNGA